MLSGRLTVTAGNVASGSLVNLACLPELQALEHIQIPCWLARVTPGLPAINVYWCNSVASQRFGRLRTKEEQEATIASYPEGAREMFCHITTRLHKTIMVDRGKVHVRVDPRRTISQTFAAVRSDATAGDLHDGYFPLMIDGKHEAFILCQFLDSGQPASPEVVRASSMQMQTPIHSYLFNQQGQLLLANAHAASSLHKKGVAEMEKVQLADLLVENGAKQTYAAEHALRSIFVEKQPAYRITMENKGHTGRTWTLFEMWRGEDLVEVEPALLVNSFDVTGQKEVEEQLEAAQTQLLIQNERLERRNVQLEEDQEKIKREKSRLLEEQQGLQDRLKRALELRVHPKTSVDTETVADKIISIFDDLLQGKPVEMSDVLELRNAANGAKDLRQPLYLQEQLMHKSGLSQDVGASMAELLQGDSNTTAKRWADSKSEKGDMDQLRPRRSTWDAVPSLHRNDVSSASGAKPDESEQSTVSVDWPLRPELEQLLQAAADTSSFQFDMSRLDEASGHKPLSALSFFILCGSGLIQMFNLSQQILLNTLWRIEEGYPDNPYHNR